ncbi:amidohydrolase family protein [Kaarinaea lacus]
MIKCSLWGLSLLLVFYPILALGEPADLYFIDAHSQVDSEQVMERIIPLMDKAGVKRTILSGRRTMQSGDIANFAEQHPQRIIASIRTKSGAYQNNKNGYYKMLKGDVKSGRFAAISELLMYHAQKGAKADEIIVYPDDKRIQFALKIAKKKGWPLVVHIEFASLSGKQRETFMNQLENILRANPEHPFAMIHMGQLRIDDVRRLIKAHNNLYFLTSHTNPAAISKSNQPWTPMFKGDLLASDWKELVVEHPDRFILAFDNVWSDQWGDFYLKEAEYWHKALAVLPEEVAHAVAHGNAEKLWNISK